eukprot:Nitzschia sp. Nitz4//scaffold125_size66327//21610//23311//NITZ4_006128-RA/size66327-augustus-gene-0.7-mRNA-1//-1//CDS//3329534604//1404//frame0
MDGSFRSSLSPSDGDSDYFSLSSPRSTREDGDGEDEDEERGHSVEDSFDNVVAQAMHSLSLGERQQALHDLHGVSDQVNDDPHYLNTKLSELEVELSKIADKPAYYMAKAVAPAYVSDARFRLLFLRSDDMNPRLAASRLVRHFELKLQLFGPDLLGRDIQMLDLEPEDIRVMESGYAQWVNQRDRAGRAVLFWSPGAHVGPLRNRFRVQFYGLMYAMRDMETQLRGMVVILYSVGKMGQFDPQAALNLPQLVRSMPSRFTAVHVCRDGSGRGSRSIVDTALRGLGSFYQVRYRAHYGSYSECMYSLMTFGIPTNALPLDSDGNLQTDEYIKRIRNRQKQDLESTIPTEQLVFIPGPYDVLMGRGKLSQENVGNLRYRALIASYQHKYESASKADKTSIADEVIQAVYRLKGRFLVEHFADYKEVPYARVREKVSHSFRSLRTKAQQAVMRETVDASDESSAADSSGAGGSKGRKSNGKPKKTNKKGTSSTTTSSSEENYSFDEGAVTKRLRSG